jgi:hypothetical protein
MSAGRSGKSHAVAWVLSILLALVLYVLTFPIVERVAFNQIRPGTLHLNGSESFTGFPKWFTMYAVPYQRLRVGALKEPLDAYENWTNKPLYSF